MTDQPLVVGVDRSDGSRTAVDHALALASTLGTSLVVVHAVGLLEEGGYTPAPSVADVVADAIAHLGGDDAPAVEVVREDGPAADVLMRVADRVDAAMIVVGRRGLGVAPRPLGSVSEAVLGRSGRPVLVVPG